MTSKQEILKQGFVDVKVFVAGLRQSHRLEVQKQKTAHGDVPFLVCKHYIPATEMVRLAEEFQLPIKHKDTVVFPKGTMPSTFAEKIATVEPDTIEAEVE
ncbi:Uncharacterised protein [Candidatus Bilamarchaeum dharawalense]|uniref:Uncharacterized protein n=1 Tax=Candidatus Bilamarchaeum dharawalense TaxID=2885759 RepID=A0A5E4LWH7_9ARCH|nr:Uncharacterised protein [Candidatus Bilamarchaeum dharawalense]